ncbi:unnamed protein product [Protopolystoma xenopodis]|uniref:Uncharacterized protein n=1 Tax=Protopolystoma xenopodis TaxID=117903 RepID=A0A3S5ACH3_9PLAT|nr:unnamed protein product [Protopolystoma xenopodis]
MLPPDAYDLVSEYEIPSRCLEYLLGSPSQTQNSVTPSKAPLFSPIAFSTTFETEKELLLSLLTHLPVLMPLNVAARLFHESIRLMVSLLLFSERPDSDDDSDKLPSNFSLKMVRAEFSMNNLIEKPLRSLDSFPFDSKVTMAGSRITKILG